MKRNALLTLVILLILFSLPAWALSPEAEEKGEAMVAVYEGLANALEAASPDCTKMTEALVAFKEVGEELRALETYLATLSQEDHVALQARFEERLMVAMERLIKNVSICEDDPAFLKALEVMEGGGAAKEAHRDAETVEDPKAQKDLQVQKSQDAVDGYISLVEGMALQAESYEECKHRLQVLEAFFEANQRTIDEVVLELSQSDYQPSHEQEVALSDGKARVRAALRECGDESALYLDFLKIF